MTTLLRAGVSTADVTPETRVKMAGYAARREVSQGVDVPLLSKALILDSGSESLVISSTDICYLTVDHARSMRIAIARELDVPTRGVIVTTTHTHSGPVVDDEYLRFLRRRVLRAIRRAQRSMWTARLGAGSGTLDGFSKNRRRPDGPVDNTVQVIRVDDAGGRPRAAVVNYSCHPTVLGPDNLRISPDYPGHAMATIEEAASVTALFLNGACGDIDPFTSRGYTGVSGGGGSFKDVKRMGRALAYESLSVLESVENFGSARLSSKVRSIELVRGERLSRMEKAKKTADVAAQNIAKLERSGAPPESLERARRFASYNRAMLRHWISREPDVRPASGRVRADVQVLQIGDSVLVGVPGELFVGVGLAIKREIAGLGFKRAMVVTPANGDVGYIPSEEGRREWGYEPYVAALSNQDPDAGEEIRRIAREMSSKLRRGIKRSRVSPVQDFVVWHVPSLGDWKVPRSIAGESCGQAGERPRPQ